MIIELSNIGPVKHMQLDLSKRLIVFMGLNGTGKTYVSYVLYALLRGYRTTYNMLANIDNKDADSLEGTINIEDAYKCMLDQVKAVNIQLPQIFNVSKDDVQFKDASVKVLTKKEEFLNNLISVEEDFSVYGLFRFQKKSGTLDFTVEQLNHEMFGKEDPNVFSLLMLKLLVYRFLSATMLTAERSGIYTFGKELSLNRLKETAYPSPSFSLPRYPLPIVNALIEADDLVQMKKHKASTSNLASSIESDMLSGRMIISSDGEIRYKTKQMTKDIAFTLASSAVKTIAPIILFLRHRALFKQMLIVDEPELNLHPKNQILIARIFARMVNADVPLIINTHSDYILRELNSMIMVNSVDMTTRKGLKYADDEKIDYRNVGVYEFDYSGDKEHQVMVNEIPVTKTGFDSALIDEVINKQMNTAQDIYLALGNVEE